VGCATGSRGEVPGERKPFIRHGNDDDDDNNNMQQNVGLETAHRIRKLLRVAVLAKCYTLSRV